MPQGVYYDGYVVFNFSTGTIDPNIDQGAITLLFSSDPPTTFLPVIQHN